MRSKVWSPIVPTVKTLWSLRYGQLSGMVEPVAGLLGAGAVVLAEPLLPYALAFAAGAMVYVVVDDIIPEAQVRWEGRGQFSCSVVLIVNKNSLWVFCSCLLCFGDSSGNGKLASWTSILGFVVMMSLDVGLSWIHTYDEQAFSHCRSDLSF